MSAYLKNLVQRAASTGTRVVAGPASAPAVLSELSSRPTMRSASEVAVPSEVLSGNSEVAAATGADTETTGEAPESRSASQAHTATEPSKLQPQHLIHDAVSVSGRPKTAQTSLEIRPAASASTLSQPPTQSSRQQLPAMSAQVSASSDQATAPVNERAENKLGTRDADVANARPRTVSPSPPSAIVKLSPAASTDMASVPVPTNLVRRQGQSVDLTQQTDAPVTVQTALIDAPRHSEVKPSTVSIPVTSQQTKAVAPQAIVPALAPALRLPPAWPANRFGQRSAEMPPSMQVRIGRVEVRAAPVKETPPAAAPASAGARGFDDYISLRAYARDNN